jgi:hypothetical protein
VAIVFVNKVILLQDLVLLLPMAGRGGRGRGGVVPDSFSLFWPIVEAGGRAELKVFLLGGLVLLLLFLAGRGGVGEEGGLDVVLEGSLSSGDLLRRLISGMRPSSHRTQRL